jgi:hypothetical protein
VSNLDWTRSCKKLSQRRKFFTLTEVVSSKRIKIDYEDLIWRGELDQSQPRSEWIEIGCFSVETECGLA